MSNLERGLLDENKRLLSENRFLKALLQDQVGEHLIEVVGDEWLCVVCDVRAPIEVDTKDYPHKDTCVLHKKQKV